MHYTLIWKEGHHKLVSTFTTVPRSHHTVTHRTSKRQPSTESLSTTTNKSCQTQTLEAVNHVWYL